MPRHPTEPIYCVTESPSVPNCVRLGNYRLLLRAHCQMFHVKRAPKVCRALCC